jgi:hypothetical protein
MKILAIGDTANVITDLKKILKNVELQQVIFQKNNSSLLKDEKAIIVKKHTALKTLKKITKKENFDCVIVMGWSAIKIAYMLGLNYAIYFVGNDIRNPPFVKKNINRFEKKICHNAMINAVACVTGGQEIFEILKKYRNDAIRIDRISCDKELFANKETLKQTKSKFTFFSPQRISKFKGFDILKKSIIHCKTDFEILQINWYDENISNDERQQLINNLPKNIKLIETVNRKDIVKYYNFSDGVIGNLKSGYIEGIGREGAICGKVVINFINPKIKTKIDNDEIIPPFLPNDNNPKSIANEIDKIVESEKYRMELINNQNNFILKLTDEIQICKDWENFFYFVKKHQNNLKNNSFGFLRYIEYILSKMGKI